MEERTYCVYKHTSPSGKVYIGITRQSVENRWKKGFGYEQNTYFWNAIKKYGWENISHEILASDLTKEEACAEEQRLIMELKATDRNYGYNQKLGGEVGCIPTKEVCRKISKRLKEFYANNPEAREKIAERVRGFRHSEEAKAKMSASKKGRTFTQTPEWKKHIGESNRAKILGDPDLYERTANHCRENGLKTAATVIQITLDGEEVARYESAHHAERVTGIGNGNIGRCCKGYAKSAGGYKWRYASEYNSSSEAA